MNSRCYQEQTACDPLLPREGLAHLSQADYIDLDPATDADLALEKEVPILARVLFSTLSVMAGTNAVLPTLNKVKVTGDLKNLAELTSTALGKNTTMDASLKAGVQAIVDFLRSASISEEYQLVAKRGENASVDEVFDEVLRLKIHRGDTFDPEMELRHAHREFGEFGGVNPSIEPSTTFTTMDPATMTKLFGGEVGPKDGCYLYSRHFNPTNLFYGLKLAAMEGTEIAYPVASGMAAITSTLMQILNQGDRLVGSTTVYGGTRAFFENILPKKMGIFVELVVPSKTDEIIAAIKPGTKVVYVETEANPTMDIADLAKIADKAHEVGAIFIVDNTFTPLTFSPKLCGADIVLYSVTKFIGGRSDSICGAICCSHEQLLQLMSPNDGMVMLLGPVLDPKIAAQESLYLNDLPLRIREHSKRALAYAQRLEEMGLSVNYPGLESHSQHELAEKMMNKKFGFGGMLAIKFEKFEQAARFVKRLQDLGGGLNAVSLGYSDTLVSISGKSTSSEIAEVKQREMGLTEGLVRLSVGYEGDMEEEWSKIKSAATFALRG